MLISLLFILFTCFGCIHASFSNIQSSDYEDWPVGCGGRIDPRPFVKIGRGYYLVQSTDKINWFDAAHACRTHKAELISIETTEEMEAIKKFLIDKKLNTENFWTSGHNMGKQGLYTWLGTATAMSNKFWAPGQPDQGDEHCVHLWTEHDLLLNNWKCKNLAYYICEMNKPKAITFTVW